jgi:hypothetical protein
MIRKLAAGAVVAVLAVLSGCMDVTTVVTVDPAGTGTVVETLYMSKAAQEMMAGMMGAMGGGQDDGAPAPAPKLLEDESKYKAKAAAMGEGVTFVSARELTKPDGSPGVQVVYAFTDITKLNVNPDPEQPGGDKPVGKPKRPIRFEFAPGETATLTIRNPKPEKDGSSSASAAPADEPSAEVRPEPSPEQLAQMKAMFDGFRARIVVKVKGEIVESNATFIETNPETGKKQAVTLVDLNIGALLGNDDTLKKLAALGPVQDMATAQEKMKDISGLRFELQDPVTVSFR